MDISGLPSPPVLIWIWMWVPVSSVSARICPAAVNAALPMKVKASAPGSTLLRSMWSWN